MRLGGWCCDVQIRGNPCPDIFVESVFLSDAFRLKELLPYNPPFPVGANKPRCADQPSRSVLLSVFEDRVVICLLAGDRFTARSDLAVREFLRDELPDLPFVVWLKLSQIVRDGLFGPIDGDVE